MLDFKFILTDKSYKIYVFRAMVNLLERSLTDLFQKAHNHAAQLEHVRKVDTSVYLEAQKIGEFNLGEDPKQVAISNEKAYVTSMKNGCLHVFDLNKMKPQEDVKLEGMPVEVLLDSSRNLCFVSEMGKGEGGENSVYFIDLLRLKLVGRMNTEGQWSKFMAIRPKSDELWVSNWLSDNISILDIKKQSFLKMIPDKGSAIKVKTPRGIAFTPDGRKAFICGYYSRDVIEVDAETKEFEKRIFMPFPLLSYQGTPRHIIIDKMGKFAYISNQGRGTIHQINIETGKVVKTSFVGKFCSTIDFSAEQDLIFSANKQEQFATVLKTNTLDVVGIIPVSGHAFGLDVSPDGKKLAIATFDTRKLEVFNLKNE